ncbi:polynucleotide adenylyltransferase PcnB [Cardiobacteriales bacterium ML27]|uniref:Poly(A) polymerase I n=2 Tax=Ostreibacterium oceani TaxID=2654998 RepID=A0A6N7EVB2_9GAMM|nr:polynucleotide adenylyltransferase PcnB [Ostreibacterium oceani]
MPKTALKVLYRLKESGFRALLVGGCLRDLLRGKAPKDFDVVTDATPDEIKQLFSNCRLIGRRFRLAHIHYGREIIEVATFRADEKGFTDDQGQVIQHNTFGTIEDDVQRRDFTLNALYYDIEDFSLIDYVGALDDIEAGIIRIIGDANERYQEDPVRMLRGVRFAAKLDMRLAAETERAIADNKDLLQNVPSARLFDETLKLFMSGHALASYEALRLYDLFGVLFPQTDTIFNDFSAPEHARYKKLLKLALKNTDYRLAHNEPVTIGFLYAVILWPVYEQLLTDSLAAETHWHKAMHESIDHVFHQAAMRVGIPMRHKTMVRDIWVMQMRLMADKPTTKKIRGVLAHKRFRAGYDFLTLRMQAGEALESTYELWTQAQIDYPIEKVVYHDDDAPEGVRKKRRRRR